MTFSVQTSADAYSRMYFELIHAQVSVYSDSHYIGGHVFVVQAKGEKLIKVEWRDWLGDGTNVKYLEPGEYAEVRCSEPPIVTELNNGLA